MHTPLFGGRQGARAGRARVILPALVLLGCVAASGEQRDAAGERFDRRVAGCRVVAPSAMVGAPVLEGCTRAAAAITRILGRDAPTGLVVVRPDSAGDSTRADSVVRRTDETWTLEMRPDEVGGELELGDGRRLSAVGYAAHESAHRIATTILFPADSGAADGARYGSPLPDWLDEGIALLTEPAADQRARLGLLFDGGMIYALPLRRFLYMAHPALAGVPAGSQLRRTFYGQSLAFSLFIQERAGAEGVRRLAAALQRSETQGVALTELPGMPRDGGALEQDWLAWLRARQGELAADQGAPP